MPQSFLKDFVYCWPTKIIIKLSAVSHQGAIYPCNLSMGLHSFLWIKDSITQFQLYISKLPITRTNR